MQHLLMQLAACAQDEHAFYTDVASCDATSGQLCTVGTWGIQGHMHHRLIQQVTCFAMQERGVYKAKWQELLSKHTSAHSATERLQKDLQQLQASYADLQQVNHALERRLLGHHCPIAGSPSTTAEHYPTSAGDQPDAYSSPARQLYSSPPRATATRAGHTGREAGYRAEGMSSWGSTSDLDRVLAEHRGRSSPGRGQAFEHSEVTLSPEENDVGAHSQLAGCVSSEDIMARLTRSPDGATGILPT